MVVFLGYFCKEVQGETIITINSNLYVHQIMDTKFMLLVHVHEVFDVCNILFVLEGNSFHIGRNVRLLANGWCNLCYILSLIVGLNYYIISKNALKCHIISYICELGDLLTTQRKVE